MDLEDGFRGNGFGGNGGRRKEEMEMKRRRRKTMSSSDACDSAFSQRQFGKKQILCLESNDLGK